MAQITFTHKKPNPPKGMSKLEFKIKSKEEQQSLKNKQLKMNTIMIREREHKKKLIDEKAFVNGYCLEQCKECKSKFCYALQGKMGMLPTEKPCEECRDTIEFAHFLNTGEIHLFTEANVKQ